ncbi:hypothetical protein EXN66_Car019009 [Channa argus]|uniref:Uncharacterized protein n=1 Tax=Channa argus TaxID=215402 RepID=A0A6G1QKW9_CHAAH|nr:hypothetical protein EXN66_Car019009 [Channa argus]
MSSGHIPRAQGFNQLKEKALMDPPIQELRTDYDKKKHTQTRLLQHCLFFLTSPSSFLFTVCLVVVQHKSLQALTTPPTLHTSVSHGSKCSQEGVMHRMLLRVRKGRLHGKKTKADSLNLGYKRLAACTKTLQLLYNRATSKHRGKELQGTKEPGFLIAGGSASVPLEANCPISYKSHVKSDVKFKLEVHSSGLQGLTVLIFQLALPPADYLKVFPYRQKLTNFVGLSSSPSGVCVYVINTPTHSSVLLIYWSLSEAGVDRPAPEAKADVDDPAPIVAEVGPPSIRVKSQLSGTKLNVQAPQSWKSARVLFFRRDAICLKLCCYPTRNNTGTLNITHKCRAILELAGARFCINILYCIPPILHTHTPSPVSNIHSVMATDVVVKDVASAGGLGKIFILDLPDGEVIVFFVDFQKKSSCSFVLQNELHVDVDLKLLHRTLQYIHIQQLQYIRKTYCATLRPKTQSISNCPGGMKECSYNYQTPSLITLGLQIGKEESQGAGEWRSRDGVTDEGRRRMEEEEE